MPAHELKPIHVTRWLDANTWKGGQRNAVIAPKRAFNWADQQGVLSPNPLRNVEKPPATRRTRIVTTEERAEILGAVKDRNFREFLTALYQTGCRPSEVSRVTAANVNLDLGVWVFEQRKTEGRQAPRHLPQSGHAGDVAAAGRFTRRRECKAALRKGAQRLPASLIASR